MSLQKLRENKTESLEQLVVIGIAHDSNQTKVNLSNFPTNPGAMADLFRRLSARAVVVDVIVQSMNAQGQDLCFTVAEADAPLVEEVLRELDAARGRAFIQKNLAKVSIVGVGMQHYHGVAAKMFETLAELGIKIELISTSEIKISALIDRNQMERAVQGLHRAFELE